MNQNKKKNNIVVIVIIIFLILAIGGYAVWQMQSNKSTAFNEKQVTTNITTTAQTTTTTEKKEVIFINKEITLKVGDKNNLLVNAPENASLNWSSSDTSVVTVENGSVKGVSKGTATITVQLGNSADTCIVKVKEKKKATPKTSVTVVYKNYYDDSYWLNSDLISNMGGDSYLANFSDWEIQEMINEILARNHYKFKTNEWFSYFSGFNWYYYDTSDMSVAESRFNSIERDNYNYLADYRNRH